MKKQRRSPQGWTIRTITAYQEIALLITGAAFLGSFVVIGMHAPAVYRAALAQMEQTYDDRANQQQYIKSLRETHKNLGRELKNFSRSLKGVDLSYAQDLLSQFQNAIMNLESAIGSEDFWNNQEVNDIQQQLNDEFQKLYTLQSYHGLPRQIKDAERGTQYMERSLKDVKRSFKEGDTSELQGYIDGYKQALESIKAQYATIDVTSTDLQDRVQDIQDALNALPDHSNPFYEVFNEYQEEANRVIQQKEAKKFMKQTKRTIKDFERRARRLQHKKFDISELRTIIEELKSLAAEMQEMVESPDFDGYIFGDLQNEFSDQESAGREAINVLEMQMNLGRWLKSVAREMKNNQRTVEDFKKQAKHGGIDAATIAELEELLESMKGAIAEVDAAYRAQDYEGAVDLQQDYYPLSEDLHEIVSSLYEEQSGGIGETSRENIEQIASMLTQALQKLESALKAGTISSELAGNCRGTFEEGQKIVAEILTVFDQGGDTSEHLQRLQALGEKLDPQCQELVQ